MTGTIWELGLDPTGTRLYLPTGSAILTFAIDGSSGALTQQGAALPLAGATPSALGGVSILVP